MTWPTFKTQEEVPEAFRSFYEEKDGEWRAKEEGGSDAKKLADLQKSVERLETSIQSERDLRKEAEKARKEAERELDDMKQKGKAEEHGITEEQLEQLRADVRESVEKEYQDKYSDYDDVKAENRKIFLEDRVKAEALKNGVTGNRIEQWWRLYQDRFDLTDDKKPMVKGRPGIEVTKLITGDLKEETPEFYEGSKMGGGGAAGDHTAGTGGAKVEADELMKNPTAALSRARERTA